MYKVINVHGCEAVSGRGGQRAVCVYRLNELFDQLSTIIEQAPPSVDSNSNTGITTIMFV